MDSNQSYWLVGSIFKNNEDQSERFIREGIWENGYKDRYTREVNSIKAGDKIAIKSTFTQVNILPCELYLTTATMLIKARGTVKSNQGNGKKIYVEWEILPMKKRWYFFTNTSMIWRLDPNNWASNQLIAFTFDDIEQNHKSFINYSNSNLLIDYADILDGFRNDSR